MYQTPIIHSAIARSAFVITGGAGFIGSHLAEYLLKHNASKVRVLDNLITGKNENIDLFREYENYEFIKGDICNLDDCLHAFDSCDYVLHEAALGSVHRSMKHPEEYDEINVKGFMNVLQAARKTNIRRLVFASSSSVYGNDAHFPKKEKFVGKPLSPYALSKRQNEIAALFYRNTFEMEVVGLRYFNVFGPRQNEEGPYAAVIPKFIRAFMNESAPVIYGDGHQARDFTFVDNVVHANMLALFSANQSVLGEMFNVACGRSNSLLQLIDHLQDVFGYKTEYELRPGRPGEIRHSCADISKAKKLLGYNPSVNLSEGLKMMITQFTESNAHAVH